MNKFLILAGFFFWFNAHAIITGPQIPSQSGNSGKVLTTDGSVLSWGAGGGGSGTVTSVDMTVPSFLSVSGNPITTSGTLAVTLNGFTTGSIPFVAGGNTFAQDNSNFFWDDTNNRLGIQTNAPAYPLDVRPLSVGSGIAATSRINNMLIGQWPFQTGYAFLGTNALDQTQVGNYAFIQGNAGDTYFNAASGQPLKFLINANEKMRVSSAGNVTIGRQGDAVTTLEVNGTLTLDGSTSGNLGLKAAATTTSHTLTFPSAQGAASTYLKNDGSGGLSWSTLSAGGSDTQIQYNSSGAFAGSANFFWDNANNAFHVGTGQNLGSLGTPYMHFQGSTLLPNLTGAGQVIIQSNDTSNAADTGGSMILAGNRNGASSFTPWAGIAGLKTNGTANNDNGYLAFYTRTNGAIPQRMIITNKGHIEHKATDAPVISSCGTSPTVVGDDNVMRVTVGTTSAGACTITFANAWTNAPICMINDETTAVTFTSSISTTALTITGLLVDGDNIGIHCVGYK